MRRSKDLTQKAKKTSKFFEDVVGLDSLSVEDRLKERGLPPLCVKELFYDGLHLEPFS